MANVSVKRFVKKVLAVMLCISLVLPAVYGSPVVNAAETSNTGWYADSPQPGQVREYCGATGYVREQYLFDASAGSRASEDYVPGTGKQESSRYAYNGDDWFTYRIPVDASAQAPLYLSMVTKGETKVTAGGNVLLDTGNIDGSLKQIPREFKLTDSTIWENGYVEVKFEDPDPSDGMGARVYWVELGKSSSWRDRAKHIVWDTSDVIWQAGYYDGTNNEFGGINTQFNVNTDEIASMASTGTVNISWDQTVEEGKKYYLLVGVIDGSGQTYIDMKNDGSNEIDRPTNNPNIVGEKVFDLDVTSQVAAAGNIVKVQMAEGARLDFATLIEVTDESTADDSLRVVFKGNEMAENWTRLANTTMYWHNEYMTDKATGFIDASLPNGIFPYLYWVADAAPAMLETARWGYFDIAKQATLYRDAKNHYGGDNGAAGLVFATIAYLIKADNYTGTYVEEAYPQLKDGLDYYCDKIDSTPVHMIKGNSHETTANEYAIYNNSIAYYALLAGIEVADKMDKSGDRDKWLQHADLLKTAIDDNLKLDSDQYWLGKKLPAGSWRYALKEDGQSPNAIYAGWFGIGSQEELYYGYKGTSPEVADWRNVTNKTLENASQNFWANWKLYGNNRGFGTDYGVLSERGGWPLNAMLMSDKLDMAKKNLEHIIWNSSDLNFPDDNEGEQETSPWLLIRETNGTDNGIAKASEIGNGGNNEDMNLVEYIVTMKNVRIMAGVDDSLYDTDNLVIIPRIPKNWEGVKVNSWPVRYRNGAVVDKTEITYDYSTSPVGSEINVSAKNPVKDAQFRFGPFETTAEVSEATVNGVRLDESSYTVEDRGDARWVWVTQDIGIAAKNIAVNVSIPDMSSYQNFNTGASTGWTPDGGTWTVQNGTMTGTAGSDSRNIYAGTAGSIVYNADVKLKSNGAGGLSFRTNSDGTQGYDFILDSSEGSVKLIKRPDNTVLQSSPLNVNLNRSYTLKVVASGAQLMCYLNGVRIFKLEDPAYSEGQYGFFAKGNASFDNMMAIASTASVEMPAVETAELNIVPGTMWDYETKPLGVKLIYNDGDVADYSGQDVEYFSTNTNVLTADGGVLTPVKGGTADVYAKVTVDNTEFETKHVTINIQELLHNGVEILRDDFSDGNLDNWALSEPEKWTVANGAARVESEGDTVINQSAVASDFSYAGNVKLVNGNAVGLSFRLDTNEDSQLTGYHVIIDKVMNQLKLSKITPSYTELVLVPFSVAYDRTYNIAVTARGANIKVYVDGEEKINYTDGNPYLSGKFGFNSYKSTAEYDDIIAKEPVNVTGISLNKTKTDLSIGGTEKLIASLEPVNATYDKVVWSSDNESVATVDPSGKVTGVYSGTAAITATSDDGGMTAVCQVTVTKSVNVLNEDFGRKTNWDGWTASGNGTWAIENNRARVSAEGKGDAWNTFDGLTASNFTFSGKITLNQEGAGLSFRRDGSGRGYDVIIDKTMNKVKLCKRPYQELASKAKELWNKPPETVYNLKIVAAGSNIKIYLDDELLIDFDDSTYSEGMFGLFSFNSTAFYDDLSVDTGFTDAEGVSLSKNETSLPIGGSEKLIAAVEPEDAHFKDVLWSSSDNSVATVDEDGNVTAQKTGTAVITVTTRYSGKTDTCTVNVTSEVYLFHEDFSSKTGWDGWTASGTGAWTIENGKAGVNAEGKGDAWNTLDGLTVSDFTFSGKVMLNKEGAGLSFRRDASGKGYEVIIDKTMNKVKLCKRPYQELASKAKELWNKPPETVYDLKIVVLGENIKVYLDDELLIDFNDSTYSEGMFGLFSFNSTAFFDDLTATKPAASVTGVTLNQSELTLPIGGSETLSANITPVDATNRNVQWTSGDESVATVDENGRVTGRATGTTSITATTEDGGKTAGCTVNVTADVQLFADNFDDGDLAGWNANGGTWQNTGTAVSGNSEGDTWNIYQNVDASNFVFSGDVTLKSGNAAGISFRASNDGTRGYDVIIDKVVGQLKLASRPYSLLTYTSMPVNYNTRYNLKVEAVGSNIKVYLDGVEKINFDSSTYSSGKFGMFSFKGVADYDNFIAMEVRQEAAVTGIRLNKSEVTLEEGNSETLIATVEPANASNKNVVWSSGDLSVATVDQNGTVTGIGAGTAVITATTEEGGLSAACNVTVDEKDNNGGDGPLLDENFDDGDLAGWNANAGTWTNPGEYAQVDNLNFTDAWNITNVVVDDFTYTGKVTLNEGFSAGLSFRTNDNGSTGYDAIIDKGVLKLAIRPYNVLKQVDIPLEYNKTHTMTIEGKGENIKVFLDGELKIEHNDSTYLSGKVGMYSFCSKATFDDLLVTKLEADETAPAEVSQGTVTAGDGQVTITWNDPSDEDLDRIKVTALITGGEAIEPVIAAKGVQTATITGLTNGIEYTFIITTVDRSGNESAGITVTGTPSAEEPPPVETYTILAEAGPNGTITPAGEATVDEGGSITFQFSANSGYKLSSILIDGESTALSSSYTFENVNGNHTIKVEFTAESSGGNQSPPPSNSSPAVNPPVKEPVVENGRIDIPAPALNNGVAEVSVTAEVIAKALESSKNDESGKKTVTINIPKVNGANEYRQSLPAALLTSGEANARVAIATEVANLEVPSNMFGNTKVEESSVALSVAKADKTALKSEVAQQIGDRPVIELNAYAGGKKIAWSNPEAPVTVSVKYVPASNEEKLNSEFITIWYIDGQGNAVPVPNARYNQAAGEITFTTTHFSKYAIVYSPKTYSDISTSWAKHKIEVMAAKGVVYGEGDSFNPSEKITRADFLKFLVTALELQGDFDGNFSDISKDAHYYDAVGIAKSLGITAGTGNGKFKPETPISRQDMMVMTAKALKIAKGLSEGSMGDLAGYTDTGKIANYAKASVAAIVKEGIIVGYSEMIHPLKNTTRAEAAVIMYNLYYK